MNDRFTRAFYNGFTVVAEFQRDYVCFDGTGAPQGRFVLAKPAILERIANRIKYGLSTVEEVAALSAIEVYENGQASNNAG